MKTINANTKIAAIIKQHPDALETIVGISPKFTKLRNPILRKVIAGRTSIAMAAKMGGCNIDDFFNRLQPLGFEIDKTTGVVFNTDESKPVPEFMKSIHADIIIELDVRPVIESGKDPLNIIVQKVKNLQTGDVLKIVNSFEPTPLVHLLGNQGFESFTEIISNDLVNTYFYKKAASAMPAAAVTTNASDWEEVVKRFGDKLETIDVRNLEMPLPMHTILESLENLPTDKALFVYHKRIPVFLLPELETQQFSYRIKEIRDGEVHMLIYND